MEKVEFVKVVNSAGDEIEHAVIDRGNGEYTSMLKSTYDEQKAQAEHFTPMIPGNE